MSDQINYRRHGLVGASPITYAAAGLRPARRARRRFGGDTSSEGELPSLDGATAWLNSPPLTADGLRGKVVLVDFWTYTCINWLRTLPYVRAWAEKYKDQGLVVIGVHTPEFAFEHDIENVRRAAKDMRVDYPIAVDNDYAIWQRFEQPLLAGPLFRRCAGAHSPSPLRRGRLRASRKRSSSNCWPRPATSGIGA